jgi:hypothetical protein
MAGCNCSKKAKVQKLNNLQSKEHLKIAYDLYNELIIVKPSTEYTDLDWVEIFAVYNGLYPNSSLQPTKEDAVEKIKLARNLYEAKHYKRK